MGERTVVNLETVVEVDLPHCEQLVHHGLEREVGVDEKHEPELVDGVTGDPPDLVRVHHVLNEERYQTECGLEDQNEQHAVPRGAEQHGHELAARDHSQTLHQQHHAEDLEHAVLRSQQRPHAEQPHYQDRKHGERHLLQKVLREVGHPLGVTLHSTEENYVLHFGLFLTQNELHDAYAHQRDRENQQRRECSIEECV